MLRNMRRRVALLLTAIGLLVALVPPAGAITNGEIDADGHPHVVLILMDVDNAPAFRCSGTLIAPTYVLTAGHCTSNFPDEPFTGMRVFLDSDVDGNRATNNYPFGGSDGFPAQNVVEAKRWAAHPNYPLAPFFVNDVGMIELEEPVWLDEYGTLPAVDSLDALKTRRGLKNQTFTAVGYGLQQINPVFVQSARVRMVAHPKLIQINTPGFTGDFSLLLSNNHSTGGTCFGDSGGANFLGDSNVVAAVTSFGLNGNCAGTGGVFRTDRQNVQDFINGFMD